jgi:neutral ceramidase
VTKATRILGRSLAGLVLLSVTAALVCIEGLDYQPYFKTGYYNQTAERLRLQAAQSRVVTGALSAGFGRALLTPSLGPQDEPMRGQFHNLPLAGYGARKGRPASGVHDDLFVKAVAFQVQDRLGVMVSADALIVPWEVTEASMARLQQDLHLGRDQVYFSATHTHASLGGWGQGWVAEAFAGPFHPGVREWWTDRVVTAVRAALADLTPASIGHGSLAKPENVRNRLVGSQGQVDSELTYLLVKQTDGDTAVLGTYGAHATVLPSSLMEFSADYPGAWQRAIEQATGGMAVFLAGSVGSHGPVAGAGGFAGVDRIGQALANAVLEQLPRTTLTNRIAFGMIGLPVALPSLHARLTDGLRLRPWLARRLLPVREETFLQAFRFDNFVWVSTPCDFSGELALGIKDRFRSRGVPVTITSFNGDYIGYIVSSRYYHMPGYEPRIMSFFGPNVPDYFTELVSGLTEAILQR